MQHLVLYHVQFVGIAIFMSLHVPAGACIPVASVSPIHVPLVQSQFLARNVHVACDFHACLKKHACHSIVSIILYACHM